MAVINADLMLSDIVPKGRFDSEYYTPEYVLNEKKVQHASSVCKKLKTLAFITDGDHSVRKYVASGIPFLTSENFDELFIDYATNRYISASYEASLARSRSEKYAIYITKTGKYYGKAAICLNDEPCFNIPADVGKIRIQKNELSPFFLVAFLNSKYGYLAIRRESSGGTRDRITLVNLGNMFVPPMSDDRVEEVVKAYISKRNEARSLMDSARNYLDSELALNKLHFYKPVGYTARFSDLELTRRFDTEHYYPAFEYLRANLPSHVQLTRLGPLLNFCQRGKQPIYSAHGLPVLNSKHILENKVTLEGNRYAKANPAPTSQIQHGDVLINGTGRGTIGRTAPYLIDEHQAIPDNHVTILRSATLDPAYLSFYLNSQAGKLQVEKYQRGSSGQLELYPFDIRKFQVWEAPQSIQQEIRKLYELATESARQSHELLDQAKSRVEQLIEEAVRT